MKISPAISAVKILLSLLLCSWTLLGLTQDCLPEGIIFSNQAQIDAFTSDYPGCTTILGDVIIEETTAGNITNLRGLSGLVALGDYLEIHDNEALRDLTGLEGIATIAGGLNIFGNPKLEKLSGLEGLRSVSSSLRIALNHELRNIEALAGLEYIAEDLTIADNLILPNLHGLESLDTVGGYLLVITSKRLANLSGLNGLRGIGKGLLVEDNAELRDLRGLDQVKSIGGNCIIVNNGELRTLDGLQALSKVGGKLQIALNPFLEDVTALRKLKQINGLLQIYANVGLKSLSGLENIDPEGIEDLAILSCDILTTCHVRSICDYLGISANQAAVSMNGNGCNFRAQILERCSRGGPSGRPPQRKDPIFYPNPTSGSVTVKAVGLEDAVFQVSSTLGRVLIRDELKMNQFDLSALAAGVYFVTIQTEELKLVQKIVKLN